MRQINGNNKLSAEIRQKSIEKASNPAYDERNVEFMQKQLDILEMDTRTEEEQLEKENAYKALKDEMYEYIENKDQTVDTNKDMSKEELEKKLNDLEVTYEILEKGATSEEKLQFYTNTKNKIRSLQEKLTNINTNTYTTLSNSSNSLKEIENSYKELRINLGLEN